VEAQRARITQFVALSSRLGKESRSASLYLKGGREVQAERFSEAINQPLGDAEEASGMALYLTIGTVRARVLLGEMRWTQELTIDVEPNDLEAAQGFFGALSNWASDVDAPRWQQRWLAWRPAFVLALVLWAFLGLLFTPFLSWTWAGQRASRAEARKLLAQGVNPKNETRAIELLLAIESNYDAGSRGLALGVRYWTYVAIGTLEP